MIHRLNVAFNEREQQLYYDLKLAEPFSQFVRAAFYEKINKWRKEK